MLTFVPACAGLSLMLPPRRPLLMWLGCALLALTIGLKLFSVTLLGLLFCKRAWWARRRQQRIGSLRTMGDTLRLPGNGSVRQAARRIGQVRDAGLGMWLNMTDTSELWSFANFLHYRFYAAPLWPAMAQTPPDVFQAVVIGSGIILGLPALWIFLRRPWAQMDRMALWEEVALVGICWSFIDPIGRTAHFVTLLPAMGLILYRRLADWHERRVLPRIWEWSLLGLVATTVLFLVKIKAWNDQHLVHALGPVLVGPVSLVCDDTSRDSPA